MNESPSNPAEPTKKAFSESYRSPIRCGVIWAFVLAIWCSLVLDMGESLHTFLYSIGGDAVLLLLIMLRRPATPTALDLFLVGWALPLIFFAGFFLLPLVFRL